MKNKSVNFKTSKMDAIYTNPAILQEHILKIRILIADVTVLLDKIKDSSIKTETIDKNINITLDTSYQFMESVDEIYKKIPNSLVPYMNTLMTKTKSLETKYYSYKFSQMKSVYDDIKDNLKRAEKELREENENNKVVLETITSKTKNAESKIDSMGSNIMSIIISFASIFTLITAINKIPPKYMLSFLFIVLWLGMTFLVFVNSLFNKEDGNSRQSTVMYTIVCILTILIIIMTMIYS